MWPGESEVKGGALLIRSENDAGGESETSVSPRTTTILSHRVQLDCLAIPLLYAWKGDLEIPN